MCWEQPGIRCPSRPDIGATGLDGQGRVGNPRCWETGTGLLSKQEQLPFLPWAGEDGGA